MANSNTVIIATLANGAINQDCVNNGFVTQVANQSQGNVVACGYAGNTLPQYGMVDLALFGPAGPAQNAGIDGNSTNYISMANTPALPAWWYILPPLQTTQDPNIGRYTTWPKVP